MKLQEQFQSSQVLVLSHWNFEQDVLYSRYNGSAKEQAVLQMGSVLLQFLLQFWNAGKKSQENKQSFHHHEGQ